LALAGCLLARGRSAAVVLIAAALAAAVASLIGVSQEAPGADIRAQIVRAQLVGAATPWRGRATGELIRAKPE
jgi:hypothetical protein